MKFTVAFAGVLAGGLIAAPVLAANPIGISADPTSTEIAQSADRPIPRVRVRVRRDLAKQLNVSPRTLRISSFSRQTWSDGCLGLGSPAESCLAALVEGWRMTLTDGSQTWGYRTDLTGDQFRLEAPVAGLPEGFSNELGTTPSEALQQQILDLASQESGLPVSQLSVAETSAQLWNGCLGIPPEAGMACTAIGIPGWRVVVQGAEKQWIYHTNQTGDEIRLYPIR